MLEEPIFFDNDKKERIMGIKHVPSGKPPYPTVILYPGLTGDKAEGYRRYVRLGRLLCSNGCQVYRFDFRGHGDSSGDFEDLVMDDLVKDSRDIFDYVKNHKDTDKSKMAVVSRSMCPGLYIRLTSRDIKAMVLHCPATHLMETVERGWGIGLRWGRRREGGYVLNPEFWKNLEKYNALTAIGYLDVPTLFITGDEDDTIWVDEVEELYNAAKEPKKLVIIKFTGHDFWRKEHEEQVHNETLNWIKKYV